MDFPWLERSSSASTKDDDGLARRCKVALDEVAHRAGLMYRLGYSEEQATQRLSRRIAWEFDLGGRQASGTHRRPAQLSDEAIAKLVSETYARRPG